MANINVVGHTAPRIYPAHRGVHWAIAESYFRETKARVAAYKV